MTTPYDEAQPVDPQEPEQDYTICPHCGDDLPHHNCQDDERDREET